MDVEPGTIVVPRACVSVQRNIDFDFAHPQDAHARGEEAYRISKPVSGDAKLASAVKAALEKTRPAGEDAKVLGDIVNAAADR